MDAVRKKLKSGSGASSVIAMLFFVTAMILGATVLSAAAANAGRATHALRDQQEYYAVESAIKLIKADMENEKLTDENGSYSFAASPYDEGGSILSKLSVSGGGESTFTPGASSAIKIEASADASAACAVEGKITAGRAAADDGEPDYTVTVELYAKESESSKSYHTYLSFSPVIKHVSVYDEASETVSEKTEITWDHPEIERMNYKQEYDQEDELNE